ncbi:MAG: hypothetical protein ACYC2H_01170 [Thermoplasmatota archaeon]
MNTKPHSILAPAARWLAIILIVVAAIPSTQAFMIVRYGHNPGDYCPIPDEVPAQGLVCQVIGDLYCGWPGGGLLYGLSPVDVDPVERGVAIANNPTAIPGDYGDGGYSGYQVICI